MFGYNAAFLRKGIEPSPLHMPLSDEPYIFTDLPAATFRRLPAMVSDALPDDLGNALINRYMAERGIPASGVTPLDRLAYMGSRAMGALTFKPQRGTADSVPTAIDLSNLVGQARQIVQGAIDDDEHTNAALNSIIDVGTSAGGRARKPLLHSIR